MAGKAKYTKEPSDLIIVDGSLCSLQKCVRNAGETAEDENRIGNIPYQHKFQYADDANSFLFCIITKYW